MRTGLSVLGIVLGVGAVIAMMSISEGARRQALEELGALGLENVVVRNRGLSLEHFQPGRTTGLTLQDLARLTALVPGLATASPLVERYASVSGSARTVQAHVLGVTADYGGILGVSAARGRFLSSLDVPQRLRVCVLGSALAHRLFGYEDPQGRTVAVNRERFTVVGVLAERPAGGRPASAIMSRDHNNAALVPFSALEGLSAIDPHQRIDEIWLRVADGESVADTGRVISRTFSRLHRDIPDFEVILPRQLLAQRLRTQRLFAVVIGSIAVVALIAGGIGIMNIMLASVLERTPEIGLRRTVGATRRDVIAQFLTEALLMTVAGGAIGILSGAAASLGITWFAGWATHVSTSSVLAAFGLSLAVGISFGLYPAIRAARLQPIDAVRYE